VLPAGGETTLFKQFFSNWKDKDQTTGPTKAYTIGKIAQVKQIPFDASSLHNNKAMAAQHNMVDDGSGKVQVNCILVIKLSHTDYCTVYCSDYLTFGVVKIFFFKKK